MVILMLYVAFSLALGTFAFFKGEAEWNGETIEQFNLALIVALLWPALVALFIVGLFTGDTTVGK